ncbi:hypothetical protein [Luteibacter sp. CQ10]|uniref:hypothetical protein n=1 Tax=Luteibacter sp. CQ10 TaxID=2805821 RepID=UPI0034A1AB5C
MEMRQAIAATLILLAAVAAVTCMAGMADGGYRIENDSRLIRAAITGFSIAAIGYYGKLRRRLKSAKSLPIGEFTLAVRGDAWLPYQAIYRGSSEVTWSSEDDAPRDLWHDTGYRSNDQASFLEIILCDRFGRDQSLMVGLHELIRSDVVITGMIGNRRLPKSLDFRLMLDIGQTKVRLILFPGFLPPIYDDPPDKDEPWREGGTTIWRASRNRDGGWKTDSDK